jgi:hypothetical protein
LNQEVANKPGALEASQPIGHMCSRVSGVSKRDHWLSYPSRLKVIKNRLTGILPAMLEVIINTPPSAFLLKVASASRIKNI